jgi:hypothetical protein
MFTLFIFAMMIVALVFRKSAAGRARAIVPHAKSPGSSRTSLFERPDTWSTVVCELPDDAVVTYCGTEGRFLRVTTADNVVGYVVASVCTPYNT